MRIKKSQEDLSKYVEQYYKTHFLLSQNLSACCNVRLSFNINDPGSKALYCSKCGKYAKMSEYSI